jgi:hypothetical protein
VFPGEAKTIDLWRSEVRMQRKGGLSATYGRVVAGERKAAFMKANRIPGAFVEAKRSAPC